MQHLHCFRHLPQQLTEAGEAVQQLMASELLSLLRFQALPHLQDHILAAVMQHQEYLTSGSVFYPGSVLNAIHVCVCPLVLL